MIIKEMGKKEPVRQCIACGERDLKERLVRFALVKEKLKIVGLFEPVENKTAYVCRSLKCMEMALKKGRFEKEGRFSRNLKLSISEYEKHRLLRSFQILNKLIVNSEPDEEAEIRPVMRKKN